MNITIIKANLIKAICWQNNRISDWVSGISYSLNGHIEQLNGYYPYRFDSAISSESGEYIFIYENLGTKGVLLKNGQFLREINRSYYCANVYEYPAVIATLEDNTYLIHCPIEYNRLDFEDINTGEIVTNIKIRNPDDMFHSRLQISPDGVHLMSKGWIWHPLSAVSLYNMKDCIDDPQRLDRPQLRPMVGVEIATASFIDNETILLGSSNELIDEDLLDAMPPQHLSRWNFKTNQLLKPVSVETKFGNLFVIDTNRAWDLFEYPKIIDTNTGEILECDDNVYTGKQQSSIISNTDDFPSIIYNRHTKQVALKSNGEIQIFTPSGF